MPYSGGPEKVIQVNQAVLKEQNLTEDEFASRVDRLHLPTILQGCARYDLGPHSWSLNCAGCYDCRRDGVEVVAQAVGAI